MTRYARKIGELTRNGRTIYYAYVDGDRDLRSRNAAVLIESYDRDELVAELDRRSFLDL